MQLRWTGANVVVVARNHNPTIVSPAWVQSHRVIEEPSDNFAHTPVFAFYESATFQLVVEQERFQLALRVLSEGNLDALAAGASRYVEQLQHIPYVAAGINFVWTAVSERPGEVREMLGAEVSERERRAFPAGELRKGILLHQIGEGYHVKLVGTPVTEPTDGLSLDFNFHHPTDSAEAVRAALATVRDRYQVCTRAIQQLLGLAVNA